jgi:hypothetical protein
MEFSSKMHVKPQEKAARKIKFSGKRRGQNRRGRISDNNSRGFGGSQMEVGTSCLEMLYHICSKIWAHFHRVESDSSDCQALV